MNSTLHPGMAIKSDGEHLILPSGLSESEVASVRANKAKILGELRSTQMDPAAFYIELPDSLRRELQAARWVVLGLETTALTRYSKPTRVNGPTTIGRGTWLSHRAANPGAKIKSEPRMRVLSLYTDDLGHCSWDLDALCQSDRVRLFGAALHGKIVIGHNLGFDLSWLFADTSARPQFVLDSMILIRQLRPKVFLRLFRMASFRDENIRRAAEEMLHMHRDSSASMEYLAACLRLSAPDGFFQGHANWCVTPLSGEHHIYRAGKIDLLLKFLKFILPDITVEDMPDYIRNVYPWYVPFQASLVRLAEAHVHGVPFDMVGAERLRQELLSDVFGAAKELANLPEYAGLVEQLLRSLLRGDRPDEAGLDGPRCGERDHLVYDGSRQVAHR